jgi:outer membrane protein
MTNIRPTLLICTLFVTLGGMTAWHALRTPKVAIVRTQDLVHGYFGMTEAKNEFESRTAEWKSNIDTLASDLQRTIDKANALHRQGDRKGVMELKPIIDRQQGEFMNYKNAIESKIQAEEDRLLAGVIAQVNSFVDGYGKEHDYDVILGTTDQGNILFGDPSMDITEDVLHALNVDHSGAAK